MCAMMKASFLKCSIRIAIVVAATTTVARADLGELGYYVEGGSLGGSPTYAWWYGCSPTSAGMMMGYYDRSGYGGLVYSNLVPGGVAEASSFGNPGAIANQAIASTGHISDFYSGGYGAKNDDVAPPYHSFNSLADFMGTSQWSLGNSNGSTTFYYYTDGAPLPYNALGGNANRDGMYGIWEYVTYAGYGVMSLYTQATDNLGLTYGFTFDDYREEIDAGRVVMIHVEGHSMFGYGYDDALSQIILNDTWTPGLHTMTWGGSYSSMALWGVTVLELSGGAVVPVPAAVLIGMLGLGVAGLKLRKHV